MKLNDIMEIMNEIAPLDLQLGFDNSGLQCGRRGMHITGIMLALDCTEEVLDEALGRGANLIITHHPLIFHPLKRLDDSSRVGRLLLRLVKNDVALYSAHTNLDIADGGICDVLAELFGLRNVRKVEMSSQEDGYARIGDIDRVSVGELAVQAKEKLGAGYVRHTGDGSRTVERLCVASGSGGSCLDDALALGADCVISGDMKLSAGLDYPAMGMDIIDAGHFATEVIILPVILKRLQSALDAVQYSINVQIATVTKDAFIIV